MELTTIAELASGWLDPMAAEDVVSWVDLESIDDVDAATIADAADVARYSHRILIGVGTPIEALDDLVDALALTVCSDMWAGRQVIPVASLNDGVNCLASAIAANPVASVTCVGLLRAADTLDVHSALVAESLAYSTLQTGLEYRTWLRANRYTRKPEVGPPVIAHRNGASLMIELNRPHRRNALDSTMRDALMEVLTVATVDRSVTAVEITGRGPSFSSGGDLAEFGTSSVPAMAHLIRTQHRPGELIYKLGNRCSIYVHGSVVGAGLELAAFADSVVADPKARFFLPEIGMGLLPGAGGTVSVARRVGRWRAAWMMLSGNLIDAETARTWGLVDRIETR